MNTNKNMKHYKKEKGKSSNIRLAVQIKKYLKKKHTLEKDSACIFIHCIMEIICFYALFVQVTNTCVQTHLICACCVLADSILPFVINMGSTTPCIEALSHHTLKAI